MPMTGDETGTDGTYQEPRVPTALRERVDELFVAYRGYEPTSFQESLSLVVDLAADAAETGESRDAGSGRTAGGSAGGPSDDTEGFPEPFEHARPIETPSTDDASSSPFEDPVSFDEYVDGLEESAEGPTAAVESMLDTQNVDGVVQELAAEVLDEMTDDAFEELEHGVDQGVGAGVTDGMGGTEVAGGETAPSGSDGDGVPDSLTADPESDCARCGRAHRVSVLQTTILDEDGSVALVCPSCAN